MPATFPSHPAAVLPIKLRWPRHFDGVALVVGSMAPDLSYPAVGFTDPPDTHAWPALLWWCLPVTVLVSWLIRRGAPEVAGQLPARWFALPDYGAIGAVRHRWYVVVWSALLGAGTHDVWDSFTHGRAGRNFPVLATRLGGEPLWAWLQQFSTLAGAAVTVALLVWIGRRRLIREWHGPAPVVPRAGWRFWWPTVALLGGYLLAAPLLPARTAPHVQVTRVLVLFGAALCIGAALTRRSLARPTDRPDAVQV